MESTSIYIPTLVRYIQHFYGVLLSDPKITEVKTHLEQIAQRMHKGILAHEEAVLYEINNYHKDYFGVPIESLRHLQLDKDIAHTLAESSAHPYDAGLVPELLAVLK